MGPPSPHRCRLAQVEPEAHLFPPLKCWELERRRSDDDALERTPGKGKSTLGASEAKCKVYLVSAKGLRADASNTKTVQAARNISDAQSIVGSYYRCLHKHFQKSEAQLQLMLSTHDMRKKIISYSAASAPKRCSYDAPTPWPSFHH